MVSIVQTCNAVGLSGSATFGAGITLGNWLVISTTAYTNSNTLPTNSSSTQSPTLGGAAPAGATQLQYQGSPTATGNVVALATWLLPVTGTIAGATAVACTWSNDTGIAGVVAYETTGWGGTPVLDRSSVSQGNSTATTSGTTAAIQYSPELIVGTLVGYGQNQGTPAGYTNTSSGTGFQATGYQIATSSGGTYAYAVTAAGGSANWAGGIITLGVIPTPVLSLNYPHKSRTIIPLQGRRGSGKGTKAASPRITIVQTATVDSAGGATYAGSFDNPVTVGNTVILAGSGYNSAGNPITSSSPTLGGSTYTEAVLLLEEQKTGAGVNLDAAAWMLPDVQTAGLTSFGLTFTNQTYSGSANGMIAYEVAGLGPNPVLDSSAGANSTIGGIQTSFSSGTTAATQYPDEFVLEFCAQDQGTTSTGQPGAPWNVTSLDPAQNFSAGWQVATTSGQTFSTSFTVNTAASYALGVVTIAPGAPPPAASPLTRGPARTARPLQRLLRGRGSGTKATAPLPVPVTPVVVQTNNGAGALVSNTLGFATNVTIGNSVVVWIGDYNTSGAAISSSAPTYNGASVTGATKLLEVQSTTSGTSNIMYFAIWLLPNVQSAGTPVGISPPTNGSNDVNSHYYIAEVSGLGASPSVDTASSNPKTAFGDAGGTLTSGATGTAVGSSGIVLGGMMQDGANTGWTGPAGWTTITTGSSYAGASYQIFSSSGTAYTWSATGTSAGQWAAGAVILTAGGLTPPAQAAPLPHGPARARTQRPPRRGLGTGTKAQALQPGNVSITGTTGAITVAAPAGTVTAVTGSPGKTIRRGRPLPRRGYGTGMKRGSSGVAVATTGLADVVQNVQVRRWLLASGGSAPYTWSVIAGSLPAGLSLASDGTLSGTPTGTGTSSFTIQVSDAGSATSSAALSLTSVSAPFSPSSPTTDGNGVIIWSVTSSLNGNDAESVRVLNPTAPNVNYPHGFLVTLPVGAGTDDTTFGNGLDTVRTLGLHNAYNLTVIEPSNYSASWLADNPLNANLIQETYLLQVAAWAQATYGITGIEKIYLIGFSRTGIAGQGLFFHRPDLYYAVASWDFPAMMTGYDGTDPNETVGGSPDASYGTQDNFTANYQLSPVNLAKWSAGQDFGTVARIWIGGYFAFQADVTQYDPVLTSAGILHYYSSVSQSEHNWSPSPGWVGTALAALIMPNTASTGKPAQAQNHPPFRRAGQARGISRGTLTAAVTGTTGTITVTAPAGTVTAVTGTPGRTVRRPLPLPRRGTGTGIFAVASAPGIITGVPGQITVTAPAGVVQAYTGVPGRIARAKTFPARKGTGRGSSPVISIPAAVTGVTGTITVAGFGGTVQAYTGIRGRVIRHAPPVPRRGSGRGIFLLAPVPGVTNGTPGLITVTAPAGAVVTTSTGGTIVAGPPGRVTLTAVTGIVTAVTGTPGRPARSRTAMPPAARRGRGLHGTISAVIAGPAGTIDVRGPAGTIQGFTGTPGRTARSRTAMPPKPGTGTGIPSGVAAVIAGTAGTILVAGPAGGIAVTVSGHPGTITVTGPAGFVVRTPYRYTRWRIQPGFAPAQPRSHLVAGSPGKIAVTAPQGSVQAI